MNSPNPLYILFGAVMGGLSVAVMIVTFDLEPGRLAMYGLMGFGLLVTVSVATAIEFVTGARHTRSSGTYVVYDPRVREDQPFFSLQEAVDAANLAEKVFVIESERVDWKRIAPQLDALFAAAGTAEYVIFNPWWPGLEKRVRMFRSVFPHGSGTFEQVAVGALTPGLATSVLTLRVAVGGAAAGTWSFGVGAEVGPVRQAIDSRMHNDHLSIAFGMVADGGAALVLDEDMETLLVRMTPEVTPAVETVLNALASAAHEHITELDGR